MLNWVHLDGVGAILNKTDIHWKKTSISMKYKINTKYKWSQCIIIQDWSQFLFASWRNNLSQVVQFNSNFFCYDIEKGNDQKRDIFRDFHKRDFLSKSNARHLPVLIIIYLTLCKFSFVINDSSLSDTRCYILLK